MMSVVIVAGLIVVNSDKELEVKVLRYVSGTLGTCVSRNVMSSLFDSYNIIRHVDGLETGPLSVIEMLWRLIRLFRRRTRSVSVIE